VREEQKYRKIGESGAGRGEKGERYSGIKLNTYRQTYTWTSRRAINRRIDINADEQTYRLKNK
jgi:hypothetical protein